LLKRKSRSVKKQEESMKRAKLMISALFALALFPLCGNAATTNSAVVPHVIVANLDGRGANDVVVNFGPRYGITDKLWVKYDNTTWSPLCWISPKLIVPVKSNTSANEDLICDFGPYGIWLYSGGAWASQISTLTSKSITSAELDGDGEQEILVDFGSKYGIWMKKNNVWTQLTPITSKSILLANLEGDGTETIIGDFGSKDGIWLNKNGVWTMQLSPCTSKSITAADIDGDGRQELIIDFDQHGVWLNKNGAWTQLTPITTKSIMAANLDGDGKETIISDFGSQYGIWFYKNGMWTNHLSWLTTKSIAIGDLDGNGKKDIIADFGSEYGIWVWYNDAAWKQLHTFSADMIVTGNLNAAKPDTDVAFIDFGDPYGVWIWFDDENRWEQLTPLAINRDPENFVVASGTQLVLRDSRKTYNFSLINRYDLFYKAGYWFDGAFDAANDLGINVIRTWGFSDGIRQFVPSFQPEPGVYNDLVFTYGMDKVIKTAHDRGVRLIIALINNWSDYGGIPQYVEWKYKFVDGIKVVVNDNTIALHNEFFTSQYCKDLYKAYVANFLNRVNSLTGIAYKDDPTILAWELVNEPRCETGIIDNVPQVCNVLQAWLEEMAAYVKSIDPNHLVSTGEEGLYRKTTDNNFNYDGKSGTDFIKNNQITDIDICSYHHHFNGLLNNSEAESMNWLVEHIDDARNEIGKPVYCGEISKVVQRYVPADNPEDMALRNRLFEDWFNTCVAKSIDGAGVWELGAVWIGGSGPHDADFFVYWQEPGANTRDATCDIIKEFSTNMAANRQAAN